MPSNPLKKDAGDERWGSGRPAALPTLIFAAGSVLTLAGLLLLTACGTDAA